MQNRNRAKASCGLTPTCGVWKQHKITPFLSIACVKRIGGTHQPLPKVGFSLGSTEHVLRRPTQNSCETTSGLRLLYYHRCTAPVSQRQQSTGIMFRHYQRTNGIFHEKEQALFPGRNRLRQKNQHHPAHFGTGRSFHLPVEDNERLSKKRVLCHEFGPAMGLVCQCHKK